MLFVFCGWAEILPPLASLKYVLSLATLVFHQATIAGYATPTVRKR